MSNRLFTTPEEYGVTIQEPTPEEPTTLKRPKRYNTAQLALAGVELMSAERAHLRCMNCGKAWSPNLQSGGRLPRGYWKCPNRCNEGAE